ncbi:NUDIX domain-containing protein [Sandaracinus amylolyticus]|uniref:NUDIX domain-containing protein n=1 Tax=Sandaracinus amylolyticus TaxID=927083 RepID=UPI001F294242|nr:NUDIX domain-containing protein [Sandaracinus amylolyticus]
MSAGMVLLRRSARGVEMLVVHPGGPFFAKKHEGAWSIPKGMIEEGEDALAAAQREVVEELGVTPPSPPYVALGDVRLKSGKRVHAWAARADFDPTHIVSNEFELEWPPRSGRLQRFPEVDRASWVDLETAKRLTSPALAPLFERAVSKETLDIVFGDRP